MKWTNEQRNGTAARGEKIWQTDRRLALPARTLIERLVDLTADSLRFSPIWGCISHNTPDLECHCASVWSTMVWSTMVCWLWCVDWTDWTSWNEGLQGTPGVEMHCFDTCCTVAHSAAVSSLTCSLLLFANPHKPVLDGSSAVRAGSSDLKSLHWRRIQIETLRLWLRPLVWYVW